LADRFTRVTGLITQVRRGKINFFFFDFKSLTLPFPECLSSLHKNLTA